MILMILDPNKMWLYVGVRTIGQIGFAPATPSPRLNGGRAKN